MSLQNKINEILSSSNKMPEQDMNEVIRKIKLQLQAINDYVDGGITSYNMKELRNTYVINAQDSLDSSYPFYVHFNIISEMTKIVSVWLDFWIMNYRAYSTAAESGGGSTSGSGGGDTKTSNSYNYGTKTTKSSGNTTTVYDYIASSSVSNVGDENENGWLITTKRVVTLPNNIHTHKVIIGSHSHTVTINDHTHTTPDHTHDISYGIHEEDNSPAIQFAVSNNEGNSYSDIYGPFEENQSAIDITNDVIGSGGKLVKFESTTRSRLSVQITVKLDIKAR